MPVRKGEAQRASLCANIKNRETLCLFLLDSLQEIKIHVFLTRYLKHSGIILNLLSISMQSLLACLYPLCVSMCVCMCVCVCVCVCLLVDSDLLCVCVCVFVCWLIGPLSLPTAPFYLYVSTPAICFPSFHFSLSAILSLSLFHKASFPLLWFPSYCTACICTHFHINTFKN